MIRGEGFVEGALIGYAAFGQGMSEIVLNNFLYGHVGVEAEAEDIVQVCSTNGVEDREFLGADQSATGQVAANGEELT